MREVALDTNVFLTSLVSHVNPDCITDATYVDIARRGIPVITADFGLYQQVVSCNEQSVNFDALRLN